MKVIHQTAHDNYQLRIPNHAQLVVALIFLVPLVALGANLDTNTKTALSVRKLELRGASGPQQPSPSQHSDCWHRL